MSAESGHLDVPTMECSHCRIDVPSGNFCGRCGCNGTTWLRPGAFGAAPGERVFAPHVASALFPHLSDRSRRPFRIAMAVALVALIGFALVRMPAAGISVAALGLPLLFLLYLRASRVDTDLPRSTLAALGISGAALGAGWVLVCGGLVARSYGVPMSVGLALNHLVDAGLVIPVAGMLLMILPTLVMRLRCAGDGESLDGFVVGALCALTFTAGATLTRLAPQVATGLIAHSRPIKGLVVEATLAGVTVPVTAAAAGGMVGILLWFHHRASDETEDHPGRVRLVLILLAVASLLAHAMVGVIDMVGLPELWMLALHLSITAAVLLALRTAMHLALLHESHDDVRESEPILCINCDMAVPDMPFCAACGVAMRASSRESRQERRGPGCPRSTGADSAEAGDAEACYPGYALPSANYVAPQLASPRFGWLLSRWGIVIMTVAVTLGGLALWLTPKVAHYMCPPDCGRPPAGTPVMALPRFTSADGAFSVSYPAPGSAYQITTQNTGVTARFTGGDGGVMQLFSERANGRSPQAIARAVVKKAYPDAKFDYEIPNAMVGYQPGYGEVADAWPQNASASYQRIRIVVLVAIKNDLALIAFSTGPYHAFGPDFGPGPPSGANLELAQDMGKYVNSFRWNGDPAR